VSMLVSFTLTPMLSSKMLKRVERKRGKTDTEDKPVEDHHTSKDSKFFGWINGLYGGLLKWSLSHRAILVLIALGTFALTYPLNQLVGRDWIPPDDQSELTVLLNMPEGTSIEGTSKIALAVADKISKLKQVEFVNPFIHEGLGSHSHIYVKLVDITQRKESNLEMAQQLRELCSGYHNLRTRISIPSALGGGEQGFPIRVLILGPDFNTAVGLSKQVTDRVRTIQGLVDVDPNLSVNNPEMQVKIDRQRASDLGIRAADVATAVRLMIAGEDQISTYKEGDEQYDVTLQLLPEQQKDPTILARLMIPSTRVGQVRLDNIATLERGIGPARIERYNRQFQVSVNANNTPALPLDVAARIINDEVKKVGLPPGYTSKFSGSVKILDETTTNLILALLLASIFMYMVLAAQFESLLHPFAIMLSLPLSIPFALLSLWMTGRTLNLWSALGVLLLLGIVKKNGILQVDYTNKLREEGMPVRDAIIQANHVRLRPILMTTLAIIAGLIPTAVGIGAGAAQRSAIAVTIIGGQSLCLIMTLLITPVAYSLLADLSEMKLFKRVNSGFARIRMSVTRVFTSLIK